MLDKIIMLTATAVAVGYLVHRFREPACCATRSELICAFCTHSAQCLHKPNTLDNLIAGDKFSIVDVKDDEIRCQLMRFGIDPGEPLYCDYVLPGGPVIVKKGRQRIAIGRNLAGKVEVEVHSRSESQHS